MSYNKHKRSLLIRHLWLGLAMFFIVFCNCPVKRFFKLQLYRDVVPVESTSGSGLFSKELKDCNMIDKKGLVTTTICPNFIVPDPQPPSLPVAVFMSFIIATELFYFFRRRSKTTYFSFPAYALSGRLPLYLQCHRLQV